MFKVQRDPSLTSCWLLRGFLGTAIFSDFCSNFDSVLAFCSILCFGGLPEPIYVLEGLLLGFATGSCLFICWLLSSLVSRFALLEVCCFHFENFWFSCDGFLPLSWFLMNSPLLRGSATTFPDHNQESKKWRIQIENQKEKAIKQKY